MAALRAVAVVGVVAVVVCGSAVGQSVSVEVAPQTVTGGSPVNGRVWVLDRGDPTPVTVTLESSNPAVAAVPQSVGPVAPGQSVRFAIKTWPVAYVPGSAGETVEIAAYPANAISKKDRAVATLLIVPAVLASLSVSPDVSSNWCSRELTATLSAPAPMGGSTVQLTPFPQTMVNNCGGMGPGLSSITIPYGQVQAKACVCFVYDWNVLSGKQQIEGSAGGVTKVAAYEVLPRVIGVNPTSPAVGLGTIPRGIVISLNFAAPPEGVDVKIGFTPMQTPAAGCKEPVAREITVKLPGNGDRNPSFTIPTTAAAEDIAYTFKATVKELTDEFITGIWFTRPQLVSFTAAEKMKVGTTATATVSLGGPAASPCLPKQEFWLQSTDPTKLTVSPDRFTFDAGVSVKQIQIQAIGATPAVGINLYEGGPPPPGSGFLRYSPIVQIQ